jgi:ADP-heptose:LPS heptosyltransferase
VLHSYSRGNGREWPIAHFAALAQLMLQDGWQPVLGGTAADAQTFAQHQHLFPADCVNLMGQDSLPGYMQRIATAAGLVACSTGPLHIASAMGLSSVWAFTLPSD